MVAHIIAERVLFFASRRCSLKRRRTWNVRTWNVLMEMRRQRDMKPKLNTQTSSWKLLTPPPYGSADWALARRCTHNKAATFRPAYPQHAGSNYPQGVLRVAQGIFQRMRVVRGYQIFGLFLEMQKLYEIRVSKNKLPALLFKPLFWIQYNTLNSCSG